MEALPRADLEFMAVSLETYQREFETRLRVNELEADDLVMARLQTPNQPPFAWDIPAKLEDVSQQPDYIVVRLAVNLKNRLATTTMCVGSDGQIIIDQNGKFVSSGYFLAGLEYLDFELETALAADLERAVAD